MPLRLLLPKAQQLEVRSLLLRNVQPKNGDGYGNPDEHFIDNSMNEIDSDFMESEVKMAADSKYPELGEIDLEDPDGSVIWDCDYHGEHKLDVRSLPRSTAKPKTGEDHEDSDEWCEDNSEMETDSDETVTDCSENGCVSEDGDEHDKNDLPSDADNELEMIEDEGNSDIPEWARWIWRMMVLYWIAVDQDGAEDHAYELQDQFRVYGRKKGLDYMFFLLRTQTVRFQLTALAAHKDLDITINREAGALNKREVKDKCILELLGEHIELRNREDVRRRAGLVEWKLIENDWEAIC
ncbi:hypothetical protein RUND412_003033 [Rhizina undulata]